MRLPGRGAEFQARGSRGPTPLRARVESNALRRVVSIISAAAMTMTAKPYPGFLPLRRDAGGGARLRFAPVHSSNSEIDANVADSPALFAKLCARDIRAHVYTHA